MISVLRNFVERKLAHGVRLSPVAGHAMGLHPYGCVFKETLRFGQYLAGQRYAVVSRFDPDIDIHSASPEKKLPRHTANVADTNWSRLLEAVKAWRSGAPC